MMIVKFTSWEERLDVCSFHHAVFDRRQQCDPIKLEEDHSVTRGVMVSQLSSSVDNTHTHTQLVLLIPVIQLC